jgi:hypothetical protein
MWISLSIEAKALDATPNFQGQNRGQKVGQFCCCIIMLFVVA